MLTDESELCDGSPKQGNGFEVSSDQEEDYFEEFHLPNSHENAFVRHKSFRRKVNLTPIDAPDAEKIEGLVRTGEFQRHGSIRRKMVPEETSLVLKDVENTFSPDQTKSKDIIGPFAKDLREIESMLDDSEVGDVSDIINDFQNDGDGDGKEMLGGANQAATSTPKSSTNTTGDYSINYKQENITEDNVSIEQTTLAKVRECLDFTNYKDIYVLSGRLQDILTAKEVEEVLNNSERYSEYVDQEVIEALHNSLQEQQNSGQFDSGISCTKKIIHAEGVDIDKTETSDIRAVIDESEPQSEEKESNVSNSNRSSRIFIDDEEEDEDGSFRFERRRSFRLGKEGKKEVEVEGVFVESKSQDIGLKKIKAPTLDLNVSEELADIGDLASPSTSQEPLTSDMTSTSKSDTESPAILPDIVITVAGDNVLGDDDEGMYLPELSDYTDNSSSSIAEISTSFTDASPIVEGMYVCMCVLC